MKNLKVLILISIAIQALASLASAEETLYNGIVLPDSSPLSAQEEGWGTHARTIS